METPFLRRPFVAGAILATFAVVTLPLMATRILSPGGWRIAVWIYAATLALPHFFATFTVYLQRENRAHFSASPVRAAIYWLAPVALLAFFALDGAFEWVVAPAALVLGALVRAADFLHLTRQGFGVLQLFKRSWQVAATPRDRAADNALMLLMALLMFQTYAHDGRFDAHDPLEYVTLSLVAVVFARVVWSFVRQFRGGTRGALAAPAAYLFAQLAAMALATWRIELYSSALAIHYVEYLFLMGPRSQGLPIAGARPKLPILYGGLLALAVTFLLFRGLATLPALSTPAALTVHAFDGLFVFHYFVEAFIWRFSEPHYRKTLAPLYFPAA